MAKTLHTTTNFNSNLKIRHVIIVYNLYRIKNHFLHKKSKRTTPENTIIPIDIRIEDTRGNTWTSSFDIKVGVAYPKIEYAGSNRMGTSQLVSLKNTGAKVAKSVRATFSTESSYVLNITPTSPVNYGDIEVGVTKCVDYQGNIIDNPSVYSSNYTFEYTVSMFKPAGITTPIKIEITDESGNAWEYIIDH